MLEECFETESPLYVLDIQAAIAGSLLPKSVWTRKNCTGFLFASLQHQAEYQREIDSLPDDEIDGEPEISGAPAALNSEDEYSARLDVAIKKLWGHKPSKFKGRIRQPLKFAAFMWLAALIAVPIIYAYLFNHSMESFSGKHNKGLPPAPTEQSILQLQGRDMFSFGDISGREKTPSPPAPVLSVTPTLTVTKSLPYSKTSTVTLALPQMTPWVIR